MVLKDLTSAEQYFQETFRTQNPYKLRDGSWKMYGTVCDFNIDRAAQLLIRYTQGTASQVERLNVADLIVRYLPIYQNGITQTPIDRQLFQVLGEMGSSFVSRNLSREIRNLPLTTYLNNDEQYSQLVGNPEVRRILGKIYQHQNWGVRKHDERVVPADIKEPTKPSQTPEWRTALKMGRAAGARHANEIASLNDDRCQDEFARVTEEERLAALHEHEKETQITLTEKERKNFFNGFAVGFRNGIDAPIRKLRCGATDGKKFVENIRSSFGENVK